MTRELVCTVKVWMEIIVFAKRVESGNWNLWEHTCTEEEANAVHDSAVAKTQDRLNFGPPDLIDYVFGAGYIFDISSGSAESSRNGDTRVYGVCVDGELFGNSTELSRHFELLRKVA